MCIRDSSTILGWYFFGQVNFNALFGSKYTKVYSLIVVPVSYTHLIRAIGFNLAGDAKLLSGLVQCFGGHVGVGNRCV